MPGTVIDAKYAVERVLGQGGMGIVLAARHLTLKHRIAIKLLLDFDDEAGVARFMREAQVLALLKSPHVARVLDVGSVPGGSPYLVMEYLAGRDYAQVIAEDGPRPFAEACDAIIQASHGLVEAHVQNIVHRDLKPSNLFVAQSPDGSTMVKVLDFGISKRKSGDVALTSTNALLGSPVYMSPEQVRSTRSVDARSDIWSLGVIFYQLVTGARPFNGENIGAIFAAILEADPPDVRARCPELPQALVDATLRCLRRNPSDRFQTVGELCRALAPYASNRGRSLAKEVDRIGASFENSMHGDEARLAAQSASALGPISVTADTVHAAPHSLSTKKQQAFAGGVIASLIVFGAAFVVWNVPRGETPRTTASTTADSPPMSPSAPETTIAPAVMASVAPSIAPAIADPADAGARAATVASAPASSRPRKAATSHPRAGASAASSATTQKPSMEKVLARD